jgi:transposase
VRGLTAAEGIEEARGEEVQRFDSKRKKTTSNKEWVSSTDADSRVAKMKDGRTHLAYKAEHALDAESELPKQVEEVVADKGYQKASDSAEAEGG